jgi:hypothetical protein
MIDSRTALATSNGLHRIWRIRCLLPLSKLITRDIMASIWQIENGKSAAGIRCRGNRCESEHRFRFRAAEGNMRGLARQFFRRVGRFRMGKENGKTLSS